MVSLVFTHLVLNLDKLFGGYGRLATTILLVLTALAFALMLLPAWRRRECAAWRGEGKIPLLTLLVSASMRLLLIGAAIGALSMALIVQRGLFAERHGQVTQRNYNAVRMKWGVPHEQRNLVVQQYVMRKVVTEELADGSTRDLETEERQTPVGAEDRIVTDRQVVPPPLAEEADKVNLKRVVRRTTLWRREWVDTDSIVGAEVEIGLKSTPRTLGNATYAGYEDDWKLRYTVCNRTEFTTQAVFSFPLPAQGHGVFDRLLVEIDGEDWVSRTRYVNGTLTWRMPLKPAEERLIEVGYASRGLAYFRYKPRNMLERSLVTVSVAGIPPDRLDYPIGSMPPAEDRETLSGDQYALHWKLSRAVTNMDVGIKLPSPEQPGYYVTKLLRGAPLGLALLALVLFVTRWLIGRKFDVLPVLLVLLAYYIGYALMGNLNDLITCFPVVFVTGLVPVTAAATWLWYKADGNRFLAAQSSVLTATFLLVYPALTLSSALGGTLLHTLYSALVIYLIALVAWNAARERKVAPEPDEP